MSAMSLRYDSLQETSSAAGIVFPLVQSSSLRVESDTSVKIGIPTYASSRRDLVVQSKKVRGANAPIDFY